MVTTKNKKQANNFYNFYLLFRRGIFYCFFLSFYFLISCNDEPGIVEPTRDNLSRNELSDEDFRVSTNKVSAKLDYSEDFKYGKIEIEEGVTADFYIINSTVSPGKLKIEENGDIMVRAGLEVATYTFEIAAIGVEGYQKRITQKFELKITKNINESDFTINENKTKEEIGYDKFAYGKVEFNDIEASLKIANSTAPTGKITVDEVGNIMVDSGLAIKDYTFQVEVTGKENYIGGPFLLEELELVIAPKPITKSDFSITKTKIDEEVGYEQINYGKIELLDGVEASFKITNSTAPDGKITVDEKGNIRVDSRLEVGAYKFKVEISGKGDYTESIETDELLLIIGARAITKEDFEVKLEEGNTVEVYYDSFNYGKAELKGEAKGVFNIVSDDTLNNKITINPVSGKITVLPGLERGYYSFEVEVNGIEEYKGSAKSSVLNLYISSKKIKKSDVTISKKKTQEVEGYNKFTYGKVELKGEGASFAIVDSTAPAGKIAVDEVGDITVKSGLLSGVYKFKIEVTGKENYFGKIKTSELFELNIARAIETSDFIIKKIKTREVVGYDKFTYGKVELNDIEANFKITSSTAPTGKITVDEAGNIMVDSGVPFGNYEFRVEVTGKENYIGKITTSELFELNITRAIETSDFTIKKIKTREVVGYDKFTYGEVELNEIEASFKITNSTAPAGKITVDEAGNITVDSGVPLGNYEFQVKVTGEGAYQRSALSKELELVVEPISITKNDFSVTETIMVKKKGYDDTSYGEVNLNPGVEASFEIINSTAPNGKINVDEAGNITVEQGLGINNDGYKFDIAVTGKGNYAERVVVQGLVLIVRESAEGLLNVFNVDDRDPVSGAYTELRLPEHIAAAEVGGNTYVFVTSRLDSVVNVFRLANDGSLDFVSKEHHNVNTYMERPRDVTTTKINGITYLLVTGRSNGMLEGGGGINAFRVNDDGTLDFTSSLGMNDKFTLRSVWGITTIEINNDTYVLVTTQIFQSLEALEILGRAAERGTNSLTLAKLDHNGKLTFVDAIYRDPITKKDMKKPIKVAALEINNTAYFFTTIPEDNEIKVFKFSNNKLAFVSNFIDNNRSAVRGATGITAVQISGGHYLFVTGEDEDGVSVFSISSNGRLSHIEAKRDELINGRYTAMKKPNNVVTAKVGRDYYLFISSDDSNGVSMFRLMNLQGSTGNRIIHVSSVQDSDNFEKFNLTSAQGVVTAKIKGITYLFVLGRLEGGVSVFQVNGRD